MAKTSFKCTSHSKEEHQQPIFGIAFSYNCSPEEPPVFATVGSNRATIYRCHPGGEMDVLQRYADPDEDENFYSCAWTYDNASHLLCAAGERGIVRVINVTTHRGERSLVGHGNSINDLRFHQRDPLLLLSASKDHSLRLWNVKTGACIAILGGVDGHRDEVLSGDFDIGGRYVVSCGMDHALKTWDLGDVIADSRRRGDDGPSFSSEVVHFPLFSTRIVHRNYIDCVRWLGQLVLSKSCENAIVLWKPPGMGDDDDGGGGGGGGNVDSTPIVLHTFEMNNCEIWYLRFALDYFQTVLACGNQAGRVFLWDLEADKIDSPVQLIHPKCDAPIRHVGFSRCGNIMVTVSDNATVWRWDRRM